MKVSTITSAFSVRRTANKVQNRMAQTASRLSSGLRINSAKDDAAGLAISERLTSRIRGLHMAQKNLNDGISLLQTSEGGMAEVSSALQRMRELAVRAANSGSVSADDRQHLQKEVTQLLATIDHISTTTEFNGISLFDNISKSTINVAQDNQKSLLTKALQTTWLEQSENAINTWYGLQADNVDLTVEYIDSGVTGGITASVGSASFDPGTGLSGDLTLTIDLADFSDPNLPNGGSGWMYYDRIIAHEMVHAVMNRTVNMQALPSWFAEGAAELIHGADKRVAADGGVAGVINTDIRNWGDEAPGDESKEYSKAYLAARYINDQLLAAGSSMSALFDELEANKVGANINNYLYDSLNNILGGGSFNNEAHFMAQFKNYANSNYDGVLNLSNDDDTGAIGGAEANGINTRGDVSDTGVIPDIENLQANPTNFNVIFPDLGSSSASGQTSVGELQLDIQLGTGVKEKLKIDLIIVNTNRLGIDDLDVVDNAQGALGKIDRAIDYISAQRAKIGSQQNRLEFAFRMNETNIESFSASRSRITDTDYAVEVAEMTRSQITLQSSSAMLAQTRIEPQAALDLLTETKSNNVSSLARRASAQGYQAVMA